MLLYNAQNIKLTINGFSLQQDLSRILSKVLVNLVPAVKIP